jgi:HEAT repeat protein
MSADRPSRGVTLPGIGPTLVVAAALSAGWLLWSEFRTRGWIPGLARPRANPVDRIQAVEALVKRGRVSVPELVEACSDPDPKTRRDAILGLGRIGPAALAAFDVVRGALSDDDANIRSYAITAFWRISRDPETAAPVIAHMLADPSADVRESAASTLEAIGPGAVGPVIEMLKSDLVPVRARGLLILRRLMRDDSRAAVAEAARTLLDDPVPEIRLEALMAIVNCGLGSPAQIRELMQTEYSFTIVYPGTGGIPRSVAVALDAIISQGPAAAELLPDVLSLFDSQMDLETTGALPSPRQLDQRIEHLLQALSAMKTSARPAVPHLLARLDELNLANRLPVIRTLLEIGAETDEISPVLVTLLKRASSAGPRDPRLIKKSRGQAPEHGNRFVCDAAGEILARVCPEAARHEVSKMLPLLVQDDTVNTAVLYALHGLAGEAGAAVSALIPLVASDDPEVSQMAVRTLGKIGPGAEAAVEALTLALDSPARSDWDRATIADALGKIGPAARPALAALLAVINEPEPIRRDGARAGFEPAVAFRISAIRAISQISDADRLVLSALRSQLWGDLPLARVAALQSLVRLAGDSLDVLGDLVRLLRHDDLPYVRAHAALAIASLTADRRTAVAPLAAALADENSYVRTAAAIALGRIGRQAQASLPALRAALLDRLSTTMNMHRAQFRDTEVWIPELNSVSVDQAVRAAMAEIERAEA